VDASDGILRAVRTLARVNDVGARLIWNEQSLDAQAAGYFRDAGLPLWWLWLAEHAEFELVVAIPPRSLAAAADAVAELHVIGELGADPAMTVDLGDHAVPLDLEALPTFSGIPPESRLELYVSANAAILASGLP
jgi:thiamine monophosphate kinase